MHDSQQTTPSVPIPLTVLSGFLGAGKTTLLNHILQGRTSTGQALRLAIIVNDITAVNIDAQLIQGGKDALQSTDALVELTNGSICSTLRDDLIATVTQMAREDCFDAIIVEASGGARPGQVAHSLHSNEEHDQDHHHNDDGLENLVRLDTMVTVVDAAMWIDTYQSNADLAALLVEQIEFANVVIINKVDLLDDDELDLLTGLLMQINPVADFYHATYGAVPLEAILNTGRFDFDAAPPILADELAQRAEALSATGFSSFVFHARRPFHPERLDDLIQSDIYDVVLRSKGYLWLASRPKDAIVLSQAGDMLTLDLLGAWWIDTPPAQREIDSAYEASIKKHWDDQVGDRRQELVFIGRGIDEEALRQLLDHALLTDEEWALGETAWVAFNDPFPNWADAE